MESLLEIRCVLRSLVLKVSALVARCEILILSVHLHGDLELPEMRQKVSKVLTPAAEFREIVNDLSCNFCPQ